jgi:hypothetical protein
MREGWDTRKMSQRKNSEFAKADEHCHCAEKQRDAVFVIGNITRIRTICNVQALG